MRSDQRLADQTGPDINEHADQQAPARTAENTVVTRDVKRALVTAAPRRATAVLADAEPNGHADDRSDDERETRCEDKQRTNSLVASRQPLTDQVALARGDFRVSGDDGAGESASRLDEPGREQADDAGCDE